LGGAGNKPRGWDRKEVRTQSRMKITVKQGKKNENIRKLKHSGKKMQSSREKG